MDRCKTQLHNWLVYSTATVLGLHIGSGTGSAELLGETIGGGASAPVATTGVWDFETFSEGVDDSLPECSFDAPQTFGDEIDIQGWVPSPESLLPARIEMWDPTVLDFDEFPDAVESPDVGGGVLAFDDPDADGFPPGSIGWMESPVINLVELLVDADPIDISFSSNSAPAPEVGELQWIVGQRIYDGIDWGPWEEVILQVQPGPAEYSIPFELSADIFQVRIGIHNPTDVLIRRKPKADKAKVKTKPPVIVDEAWKYVPDIKQKGATCAAASTANCLAYWAKNGYPEITSDDPDTSDVHDDLRKDLEKAIYGDDKKVGGTDEDADSWPGGISSYLKEKKVYDGEEQPAGRAPLVHERKDSLGATWDYLCDQFGQCNNVLVSFGWYDEDGNLKKPRGSSTPYGHQVTMGGKVKMSNGKSIIHVANPWGDQHDEVNSSNRGDAYIPMEVEVGADGRIKLKNEELQKHKRLAIDGYLCVREINVVRPKEDELAPPNVMADLSGELRWPGRSRSGRRDQPLPTAGDLAVHGYSVLNDDTEPLHTFAMMVEVPYSLVESPPGWDWAPLPQPFSGSTGCGSVIGQKGIVWTTDTDPLEPGEQVSGFRFSTDSSYPVEERGVQWYTEVSGFKGIFGFVDGPVAGESVDVDPQGDNGRTRFALHATPNPAFGEVDLHFALPSAAEVRVSIFDPSGRRVRELARGQMAAGSHSFRWDRRDDAGRPVATGVFLYRLDAGGRIATNKLQLLK